MYKGIFGGQGVGGMVGHSTSMKVCGLLKSHNTDEFASEN